MRSTGHSLLPLPPRSQALWQLYSFGCALPLPQIFNKHLIQVMAPVWLYCTGGGANRHAFWQFTIGLQTRPGCAVFSQPRHTSLTLQAEVDEEERVSQRIAELIAMGRKAAQEKRPSKRPDRWGHHGGAVCTQAWWLLAWQAGVNVTGGGWWIASAVPTAHASAASISSSQRSLLQGGRVAYQGRGQPHQRQAGGGVPAWLARGQQVRSLLWTIAFWRVPVEGLRESALGQHTGERWAPFWEGGRLALHCIAEHRP